MTGSDSADRRISFRYVKRMAPCDEGLIPGFDQMQPVQCHELGFDGLTLFLDEPPGFERFVICLSDEMTMLCRVRDFHAAYWYDRHGFVTNAIFIRRLPSSNAIGAESCAST